MALFVNENGWMVFVRTLNLLNSEIGGFDRSYVEHGHMIGGYP